MRMKKIVYGVMLSAMAGMTLLGCYPQGPEYVEDLDVVYTTYDEEYDFQGQNTFALPDKIVTDVKIKNGDTTYVYMKDAFALPILQAIENNMEDFGWTKVPDLANNPDVIITPAAISSTTYYYSYWYDWWYGGYYGGYWGWYYPPYYSVSSITTGSLVLTMSDPGAADESPIGQSQASWLMVANGVATGYGDISRVTNAIDQGFKQSPYLKTN
jgi:hypothetical protein